MSFELPKEIKDELEKLLVELPIKYANMVIPLYNKIKDLKEKSAE